MSIAYIAETLPISYSKVALSTDAEKWQKTVEEEKKVLQENETLSKFKRVIGKEKFSRYKARYVAKYFSQQEGMDNFETSAPIVRRIQVTEKFI